MKKRVLSMILTLCVVLALLPAAVFAEESYGGGSGDINAPYIISTGQHLAALAAAVNNGEDYAGKYFKLENDIDLEKEGICGKGKGENGADLSWTPIGTYAGDSDSNSYTKPFSGHFDGNGNTVSGLYISSVSSKSRTAGLFSYCGENSEIQDLNVNGDIAIEIGNEGGDEFHAGGICGYTKGNVTGCSFSGTVALTNTKQGQVYVVGGICGWSEGTVANCSNSGDCSNVGVYDDGRSAGGVCGMAMDGKIENCYNTGNVSASGLYPYAGGVCGAAMVPITNCYNTGNVSVSGVAWDTKKMDGLSGGVCGYAVDAITNCYNTGEVSVSLGTNTREGAMAYAGGVCGTADTITNCYNTGEVSVNRGDNAYEASVASAGGLFGYSDSCTASNCYFLQTDNINKDLTMGSSKESKLTDCACKAEDAFKSGEVAYLLQNAQTEVDNAIPLVWGQRLKGETVDASPILTAEETNRVYKVTYKEDGKDDVYGYGNPSGVASLPEIAAKEGCIAEWQLDGAEFTTDSALSGDSTLTAAWMPACTVTFDSQGGSAVSAQTVGDGGKVTKPEDPTREGHIFGGWYTETACTNEWDFDTDTVTEDTTLYAKWTAEDVPSGDPGDDPADEAPSGPIVPARPVKPTGACPKDETCPIAAFTDASPAAWYHDGVHYCLQTGLMEGYGDGKFGPNNTLTRAQLAQILYNQAGKPDVTSESEFEDVQTGAWYYDAIVWATENGVVNGYGNGKFGPNDNITREQLAAMLCRRAGAPETAGTLDGFTDANNVSEYAETAMKWAVEKGIVEGKGNGVLDPRGNATRAEAATMLTRYFTKVVTE